MLKIKMTQAQVDKLFVGIVNDLNSKLDENVEIIFEKLFPEAPQINNKKWNDFLFENIKTRLLVELNALVVSKKPVRRKKHDSKAKKATAKS